MKDARAIMNEAIDQLHQTHFGIIPSDVYKDLESPHSGPGEVGIELRIIDGRAVVTAVTEDQPASAAGVKTGWIVEKIAGKPVSQILQAAEAAYAAKSGMLAARKTLAVEAHLHGPIGSAIALDFIDQNDKPIHLAITASGPGVFRRRSATFPLFMFDLPRNESTAQLATCRSISSWTWSTCLTSIARRSRRVATPTG